MPDKCSTHVHMLRTTLDTRTRILADLPSCFSFAPSFTRLLSPSLLGTADPDTWQTSRAMAYTGNKRLGMEVKNVLNTSGRLICQSTTTGDGACTEGQIPHHFAQPAVCGGSDDPNDCNCSKAKLVGPGGQCPSYRALAVATQPGPNSESADPPPGSLPRPPPLYLTPPLIVYVSPSVFSVFWSLGVIHYAALSGDYAFLTEQLSTLRLAVWFLVQQNFMSFDKPCTFAKVVCGVWCMVYGVWCMVHGVCCMLYAVCCMLYAVCCMLYAVCCML
jgi:hypothetical protein